MSSTEINELVSNQKYYFKSQQTKSILSRRLLLKQLKKEILKREQDISDALNADFKKPQFESFVTETGIVLLELDLAIANITSWSKPKRIPSALLNFPSTDYIYKEPYGTTLIIAPWNYPFQLAIAPLIGALAAGNTVILKPSELTPHTSQLLFEILSAVFKKDHVAVVQGGVETSQYLLKQSWDYIFFTGSVQVGKIVAKAAAENLTPTTLELGGKNPCIVDETVNLKLAARRLVWGKFLNAGQTCIAPDYLIVHKTIKDQLISRIKTEIQDAYTEKPETSPDYPRIINTKNFERLKNMLSNENIAIGGSFNEAELYIEPTIIDSPSLNSEVMKDEIFGPILPILTYETKADIDTIISHYNKPLSLYVFSKNKAFIKHILNTYSFGGGAINDTVIHFINHKLPFGGVGNSGIGAYHGKLSFDTFSHKKSITKHANWLDLPFRYAPYNGKLKFIKQLFKYLG